MSMDDLINKIKILKQSEINKIVGKRIQEFKNLNKKSNDELFKELCFCILTANFSAEKSIKIQNEIGECFLTDSCDIISKKLKDHGHRFPNMRAKYISNSMKCKNKLKEVVQFYNTYEIRDWIVKNVKGIGYKESSHFLRNIGFDNFAIIDFHIIDILTNHNLITKPKSLTKKKYLEIENLLKEIALKTNLTLAELDLYLWYMETGKILK
jgi:N-glycosylase/DNA lyase